MCIYSLVKKAATFALAHLSEDAAIHAPVIENNIIPSLIGLMNSMDFSALVTLANMCENESVRDKLHENGVDRAVIKILKDQVKGFFPEVATTALMHLSKTCEECRQEILRSGVITSILKLFDLEEMLLRRNALTILVNLSHASTCHAAMPSLRTKQSYAQGCFSMGK
jgi:hypothetical protein